MQCVMSDRRPKRSLSVRSNLFHRNIIHMSRLAPGNVQRDRTPIAAAGSGFYLARVMPGIRSGVVSLPDSRVSRDLVLAGLCGQFGVDLVEEFDVETVSGRPDFTNA